MSPDLREVVERARLHVLSGKGAYVVKGFEDAVPVDVPDGPFYFLPRAWPVYGVNSTLVGATLILQDVTRLRRFDDLKNDLVATVAHEFGTPLTSLRMAIHLCLEQVVGPLTEKQAELLTSGREDCERLQGIVDDLLNLASIQAGRFELQIRTLVIDEIIQKAISASRSMIEQKKLAGRRNH